MVASLAVGALWLPLPNRRATVRLGRALGRLLRTGDLVVLGGGLGAGKTFLARAICRSLGVPPEVRVPSPSFALVHEHSGRLPIVHADLYRIGAADEVRALGLREARAEAVVLVEWGAPFAAELGGASLEVELRLGSEGRSAALRGARTEFDRWRGLASLGGAVAASNVG